MKRNIYAMALCLAASTLALTSCLDDKSANDFDSAMPDVTIALPKSAYSAMKGMSLTIEPEIKSDIDDSELTYTWEVLGDYENEQGRYDFFTFAEGRVLNWTADYNDAMSSLNKAYTMRLHAYQKSTGRDFYSNTSTITIDGLTGLLLVYGDGNTAELGLLKAEEFLSESSLVPDVASITCGVYGMQNGGESIKGKGVQVLQIVPSYIEYYGTEAQQRCYVVVRTDQECKVLGMDELNVLGGWDYLFRFPESLTTNTGTGIVCNDQVVMAWDGDVTYATMWGSTAPFGYPEISPDDLCGQQGYTYVLAPFFIHVGNGQFQAMTYANSVNGDSSRKGFVGIPQAYLMSNGDYRDRLTLIDTEEDEVIFNPGDMKADLVSWAVSSNQHVTAILKGCEDHPTEAGKYFEIDMYSDEENMGNSTYQGVPKYLYDLSGLVGIDDSSRFAIGSTYSMNYYTSGDKVYQFVANAGEISDSRQIVTTKGANVAITGEVTAMEFLQECGTLGSHNAEPILVVATYDGSVSRLYALHIDTMTGAVKKSVVFGPDNIEGWDIRKPISAFCMKGI